MATHGSEVELARQRIEGLVGEAAKLRRQERFLEAERDLLEALSVAEKACGGDSVAAAGVLAELGGCYHVSGRLAEAEASYRRALDIRRQLSDSSHSSVAALLHDLALVCKASGRADEAERLWAQGRALFELKQGAET